MHPKAKNLTFGEFVKVRFGGVLRKGAHTPDGQACVLEARNVMLGGEAEAEGCKQEGTRAAAGAGAAEAVASLILCCTIFKEEAIRVQKGDKG